MHKSIRSGILRNQAKQGHPCSKHPESLWPSCRRRLDPKNILANEMVDALLPLNA